MKFKLFESLVRRISALSSPIIFLVVAVTGALAHDPGLSAAVLKLDGKRVEAHLTFARVDIESLLPLDANGDGHVSQAEFKQSEMQLLALAKELVVITVAGHSIPIEMAKVELDDSEGIHFKFFFIKPEAGTFTFESKLIEHLSRGHRQYLELIGEGNRLIGSQMLEAAANRYEPSAAAMAEAAEHPQSFWEFFKLGIEHIVTGFDHLAFLLALLLAGSGLREAAKIITSFTIAHSITLALATFDVVNMPSGIVEPIIALSIVYVGLENIIRREVKNRWLLTFVFGLIHGFGFASVLRELGIAEQGSAAVVPLFSFNLGVELGQVTIAAMILPLIWKLRKQPKFVPRYVAAFSVLIALAGGYWLIERALL